jgi:hypothetical protein
MILELDHRACLVHGLQARHVYGGVHLDSRLRNYSYTARFLWTAGQIERGIESARVLSAEVTVRGVLGLQFLTFLVKLKSLSSVPLRVMECGLSGASHVPWVLVADVFVLRPDAVQTRDAGLRFVELRHVVLHVRVQELRRVRVRKRGGH